MWNLCNCFLIYRNFRSSLLLVDVFENFQNLCQKKGKNDFQKDFFKLINFAVFAKTMENVRKHRDIKLVTTQRRRNYLKSEPNYDTKNFLQKIY